MSLLRRTVVLCGKSDLSALCLPSPPVSPHRRGHRTDAAQRSRSTRANSLAYLAGAVGIGFGGAFVVAQQLQAKSDPECAGDRKPSLPEYSREEVNRHDSAEKRIWVTYGHGVYDITDFVSRHPGAKNIEMAAGGAVEPFWEVYAVHKDNPQVFKLLEEYRIGNVKEDEYTRNKSSYVTNNPFANEPKRHPALKVVGKQPFNAETQMSFITDSFYTPNELFYVRNHLPTPDLNEKEYELEISGIGIRKDKMLKLKDIKALPSYTITATIQCGGNRRSEMNSVRPLRGYKWTAGAIGNAKWTGAKLSDVLHAYGISAKDAKNIRHIQFEGYDLGADGSPYGASIPFYKGINPDEDVLLAYEMNDKPLSRDHGYPIRVIVPGVVGARNVKWLNRIILSTEESDSHWHQNDYKSFNTSVDWHNVDFSKSPAIQNMPVTSAICFPEDGNKVQVVDGKIEVKGYAWSGGGNRIIRVDITSDEGKTWSEATIIKQEKVPEPKHYSWTLWKAEVKVPKGIKEVKVWSKAVDSNYNVQPEKFEHIWNLRGLLCNAYSKVTYKIK